LILGTARTSFPLPLAINFFTADILEKAARAKDSVSSQARYHAARRKLYADRIEIIKGYFSPSELKAKVVNAEALTTWPSDCQEILVLKLEEMRSDVSLALQAYHNAVSGQMDHAVIVTNDTDFVPALELIRAHTNSTIGLVIRSRQNERPPSSPMASLSLMPRPIRNGMLLLPVTKVILKNNFLVSVWVF
jgi:6-hydroxy-3-succinoylpyridine 3-monooxygenase